MTITKFILCKKLKKETLIKINALSINMLCNLNLWSIKTYDKSNKKMTWFFSYLIYLDKKKFYNSKPSNIAHDIYLFEFINCIM